MPKPFELVYEGPIDDTSDTLRKVKAVFLAELNFSIEKTKEILEKAPLTVIRADEEMKVTRYAQLLSSAGARVHIVVPESEESIDEDLLDIEIEFDEPKKKQKVYSLTDETSVEELEVEQEEEEYDISSLDDSLLTIPEMMNLCEEAISDSPSIVEDPTLDESEEDSVFEEQREKVSDIIDDERDTRSDNAFELSLGEKEVVVETEETLIRKMEEAENKLSVSTDFSFNDDPLTDRFKIPDSPVATEVSKNKSSSFDLSFAEEPPPAEAIEPQEVQPKITATSPSWELSLGDIQEEAPKPVQVSTKPVTPPKELDELFNSYETEEENPPETTFNFNEKKVEPPRESIFVDEAPPPPVEVQGNIAEPHVESEVIFSRQTNQKRSIPFTPIFCILGVLSLWGLNHLYFSFTHVEENPVVPQVTKPKKTQESVTAEVKSFSKISIKDGVEVSASGEIVSGSIKSISIAVKNSTADTLKVEKLLFEDIPVEDSVDGKFSLHGPVRISVLEGRETTRVIGTGVVQGRLNSDALSLTIEAKYQADAAEKTDSYIKKNGARLSLSFQTSQVLR